MSVLPIPLSRQKLPAIYQTDGLKRLTTFRAGQISSRKTDMVASSLVREQVWTLTAQGNSKAVNDFGGEEKGTLLVFALTARLRAR